MKRIISLVTTIVIIVLLIVTSTQSGSSAHNGNAQLPIGDCDVNTEDFPLVVSSMLTWQPCN